MLILFIYLDYKNIHLIVKLFVTLIIINFVGFYGMDFKNYGLSLLGKQDYLLEEEIEASKYTC